MSPEPDESKPAASIAIACAGAVSGAAVLVLLTIVFFQWAGGITPYDILTLDQASRLELEGLVIVYMQMAVVVLGAPLGCWIILRRKRARAAGATAILTIPWFWFLQAVGLRWIPNSPGDPVLLPYAYVGAVAIAAALARLTYVIWSESLPDRRWMSRGSSSDAAGRGAVRRRRRG